MHESFEGAAGILDGKYFCSEVQNHPLFAGAIRTPGPAVRDGHIITGFGTRVFHFTALLLESLIGQEKAMQYRQWAGIDN